MPRAAGAPSMTMPAIRVLGAPSAAEARPGFAFPAKGFQLLALLARAPSGMVRRREAASLLWDAASDAEAFVNLRQLLARVRRFPAPAGAFVVADTQSLILGPGADAIDLCAFDRLIGSGRPEQIREGVALFQGELLEGIEDVNPEFLDWLMRERARLREQFFAATSHALMEMTRYGRASERDLRSLANRMLAISPEREETYRVLIEAFGRNGSFDSAARLYEELSDMLVREHSVSPSIETTAVARRVFAAASQRGGEVASGRPSPVPRVAFFVPRRLDASSDEGVLHALIEDVANELTRYRTFAVLAAHSSFQVDHDSGMPTDNTVLRADYTVSGFVRRDGGGPTLVLRMTRCAGGTVAWSGDIPFGGGDLVEAFRRISLRVASSLAAELERDALSELRRGGSQGAYRCYLEGQVRLGQCDLPRLRQARARFREAVASDPGFAAPHARIAQTLYLEWLMLGGSDPLLLRAAREAAQASVRLDHDSALGHWMSAVVALYQRDFDEVEDRFAEAETLNPHSADLLLQHGDALACFGRADDGWQRFSRALDLNPLPPDHYWWAGASIAFNRGDFNGAIELCGRLASDESVLRILTVSHARIGDREQASLYARRLIETYPGLTAAEMAKLVPYRDLRDREAYADGLRLAGIP